MVLVSHLFLFIHVFIITIACSRWPWKLENKADVRSSISPGRVSYSGSHWLVLRPLARLAVQCKHMFPLQVRLVRKGVDQHKPASLPGKQPRVVSQPCHPPCRGRGGHPNCWDRYADTAHLGNAFTMLTRLLHMLRHGLTGAVEFISCFS